MQIGDLDWYRMVGATITALYHDALRRAPDDEGRAFLLHAAREEGRDAEWMRAWLQASAEYAALHAPPPPPPPPPPPDATPRPIYGGRLRTLGRRGFQDDVGPVTVLGTHDGTLLAQWMRGQADAARERVRTFRMAGYPIVRAWLQLGDGQQTRCDPGAWWAAWAFGPYQTPDYWPKLRAFCEMLRAEDMRLCASQGDPGQLGHSVYARAQTMVAYAAAFRGLEDRIAFIDLGNEARDPRVDADRIAADAPSLAKIARAYKDAGGPGLLSLCSVGEDYQEQLDYATPPADVFDWHSPRGPLYFAIDHIISKVYEDKPALPTINSEPPGPGAEVTAISRDAQAEYDHEGMFVLAAAMCYTGAGISFTGSGVRADRDVPHAQQPGWRAVPKLIDLLPKGCANWQLHHSGETWRGRRVFALGSDQLRVDGAINDSTGEFVYVAYPKQAGTFPLRVERGFTGTISHGTATGCETHPLSGSAGQTLNISMARGRVIVGRLA